MARRSKDLILKPWESAHGDNKEKRAIWVGNSLILSKALQALDYSTRWTYFSMCMEAAGNRRFQFTQSAAKKYGIKPATFRRAVNQLIEAGFIQRESGWNVRQPNDYMFAFGWKERPP